MTMKVHFEKATRNLREMMTENAERAKTAVSASLKAVQTKDLEFAESVVDGDMAIDMAENMIEEQCLNILALYQPVAEDLRRIAAILKANGEIERAGDLASSIEICPWYGEFVRTYQFFEGNHRSSYGVI